MKMTRNRLRIAAGWVTVPLFLLLARPTLELIVVGTTIALLGAALRAWAAGTIHKNKVLTTSGPYAFTRNPLYLGSFIIGIGLVIASGRLILLPVFLGLCAFVYGRTIRAEARRLESLFGETYHAYASRVPLFLPRLTPYPTGGGVRGFRLERYLRNSEYQAALGILACFLALLAKMTLA